MANACTVTSFTPAGGPTTGGTRITITGTYFSGSGDLVTGGTINGDAFVNADLDLVIVSATEITLTMPPIDSPLYTDTVTPGTAIAVELTNPTGTSSNDVVFQYWDQTFKTPSGQAPAPAPGGNKKEIRGYFNLGPSYTTGGLVIPPGLLGLTQVDEVVCCNSLDGRPVAWVPSASAGAGGTLKVFSAIGTEIATTVDLHADSVFIVAWGK